MSASAATIRTIYIIRHAEKPFTDRNGVAYEGVTITGKADGHSLIPRGWQRAGALVRLLAPLLSAGVQLFSPGYGKGTEEHRTYQTLVPLSELLGIEINTSYKEKEEQALGEFVAAMSEGNTVICWEHTAIRAIVEGIAPIVNKDEIPVQWGPEERFDVTWSFARKPANAYRFAQLPQMLLAGDKPSGFPPPH